MDVDKLLVNAIQDGIREGIKTKLNGYNSPLDKMIADCLSAQDAAFRSILSSALASAVKDDMFREQVASQVRHKLASVLGARFGGELERQINQLKSDPTTRARIALAIEEIVKERAALV